MKFEHWDVLLIPHFRDDNSVTGLVDPLACSAIAMRKNTKIYQKTGLQV